MTEALGEAELAEIIARDEAAGDGLAEPDYRCAEDRHTLLTELNRLRTVVSRLSRGVPTARNEGTPWSE